MMDYNVKIGLVSMRRNTRLSISEISDKCGFSSISYFCRVFKEDEACTPYTTASKVRFNTIIF